MLVEGGRPLYALYTKVAFGAARGIGDLGYIRTIGVVGISVVSTLVYRALSQTMLPRSAAIAGALLFCLTPSYQVYAAWAVASPFPWACVLAAAAFWACDGAINPRLKWGRLCGAIILLALSITIYQPAAMVFWDFAAIAWLMRAEIPSAKSILVAGVVMFFSLALDYGAIKLAPIICFGSSNGLSRTALVHDFLGKIIWFFKEPLFDSINIFRINPGIEYAVVFAVIIISGFFLFFGQNWRRTSIRIGIALPLIPASYVPNLVVAENWASYRTQVALTGLILIFAIIAFAGWVRFLKARRFVPILCMIAVAGSAMAASRNVTAEFAVPEAIEYHLIENALLRTKFSQNDQICFDLARWQESFAPISRYDEFGTVSSSETWVPASMSWLILTEHHSAHAGIFMDTDRKPPKMVVFPGCKEINLNAILSRDPAP